jgi:signal transduction histidine kinase/FixJ family two-component response regulator
MAVKRALHDSGLSVELVELEDGDAALAAMRASPFDCVLLDLRMPGRDGLEVLRLARLESLRAPIVMLTGYGDENTAVELMKAGAADYLAKGSLTPQRLAEIIRHALRVSAAEAQALDARAAIARYTTQLRELAEAAGIINRELAEDEVLWAAADCARRVLGVHVAVSWTAAVGERPPSCTTSASERYSVRTARRIDMAAPRGATRELRRPVRLTHAQLEPNPEWLRTSRELGIPVEPRGWLAAPLFDRTGALIGVLHVTDKLAGDFNDTDESILVQLAQLAATAIENARLYAATQEATRARDDMVAIVSHDLRNPLNNILLSCSLLERTVVDDKSVSHLQRLQRAARQMNHLVNDLLDVSKIQAGKLSIQPAEQDAATLLDDAIDVLKPLAADKGICLEVAPPARALRVWGDSARLLQVLGNLLGNAVKFTPRDGRVRLRAIEADGAAHFSVEDSGPGIPAHSLERLFDRFWQGERDLRNGAGLGLFIAKGIVEAHGGRLTVESTEGSGATFRFSVPIAGHAAASLERKRPMI